MNAITSVSTVNAAATQTAVKFFQLNHIQKQIIGSEYNFKMSGKLGSAQYNELMVMMARHSDYVLTPIASKKKVAKKQTYAGLTQDLMLDFFSIREDKTLYNTLNNMIADGIAYPTIKSWFLDQCDDFDVNKAKDAIRKHKLAKTKNVYRVVRKTAEGTNLRSLAESKLAESKLKEA